MQIFFSFFPVKMNQKFKEITQLNPSKASQFTNIPTKIVKQNVDIFADIFLISLNQYIALFFRLALKIHNLAFKKSDRNVNVSKIFEQCIFQQISNLCSCSQNTIVGSDRDIAHNTVS